MEGRKARLRELREQRCLTQAALAYQSGVSIRTISSIESGASCRMSVRRRLLKALRLPFETNLEVFGPLPVRGR
jgi:transcriptional regulator with XRE-family HTH domain